MNTIYDFPIGPGNPRNSEGSFLALDDETILFVYTAFSGERARDYTPANLCLTRSSDSGRSWSAPKLAVPASDFGAMNVMSVSLLRMANGDVGLFFLARINWVDMYIVHMRSSDRGKTWSVPVRCSTRPGYFVINNDRVTRLSSGRIIIPAAEHKNVVDADGKVHFAPATTTFFYSDDDGINWSESQTELQLEVPAGKSGLQEPGIVELTPGHLYGWARTDLGRQYEFTSSDNGVHWSQPVPSRFTSPLSPLSMKRLTDGQLMAIWNPVPLNNIMTENKATGNRTPLVYALSENDGADWTAPSVIEDDSHAGYCYTAMLPLPGAVLLAYCAGTSEDMGSCLNRLRIRLLQLPDGKQRSADMIHTMGIGF